MSNNKTKIIAAATLALSLNSTVAQSAPGYQTSMLEVKHREQPLALHIWYPAKDSGGKTMLGKNAVFTGIEVQRGAAPNKNKAPLVLLSHGSGGNAVNIGWIAARLANEGAIVVSTNHPGTTSRDSHPHETVRLWQRTADFSAILDHLQNNAPYGLLIDSSKIGAVGFSLGGHTVLGLAGAQVKKQKFIDYCDQYPKLSDCIWIQKGVDLKDIDAVKYGQSNLDPRIKAIVAVDPALAQAYDAKSLQGINKPILVINLGSADKVPAGINGHNIIKELPSASYATVKGATHFSFLGKCRTLGKYIIKSVGEEPICSEVSNRIRADIHVEIGTLVVNFMKKHLF